MKDWQLRQVLFMYYKTGMTQREITEKFSLSKMMVSRMLQKAKKLGVVKIDISLPFELNDEIQQQVRRRYGLKKVLVVKRSGSETTDVRVLLGRVWAFYMGVSSLDDYILGVGVGNTIGQVVRNLFLMRTTNLHIVQLMGGLANVGEQNPFTIVQELCRKLQARGTYLTSFALVENEKIKNSIFNSPMGHQVRKKWGKCQKALFGVGAARGGTLVSSKLLSVGELQQVKQLEAVGDILGHYFDIEGNFVDTDIEKRLVSIPVSILREIPDRIAIAGGEHKTQAIVGALRSGLITALITDESAAKKLLQNFGGSGDR